ncbi:MAG: hypothetical protein VX278_13770 [Myxococcota bacterium]|nr:hypothetical protein [Myxococcota bacterium]
MSRFFWLHLIVSLSSVFLIEILKHQWVVPEEPSTPSDVQVIAIPPKPEGVNSVETTDDNGSGTHYTEEKCREIKEEYRDICFHQLARQSARDDLADALQACTKIEKKETVWECMADIAELYAPKDRTASLGLCPQIKKKKWRDQCVFGIALALSTIDPPWAFRTCDQAGKWRDFCRHDVNGEIAVIDTDLSLAHCAAEEGDLLRRKTCWHGIGKYIARVDVDKAFAACEQVPMGPDRLYRENCYHGLGWGASEKAGVDFADRCSRSGEQTDSCILGVAYNLRRFDAEAGLQLCKRVVREDLRNQCTTFLLKGSIHAP